MTKEKRLTGILADLEQGREGAMDDFVDEVYPDLRGMALRLMNQKFGAGHPGVTLQPTALVHETFLKLLKQRKPFQNQNQFFALATRIMLRVLIDYSRKRGAAKRGGGRERVLVDLDQVAGAAPGSGLELESLIQSLEDLSGENSRQADVVKLRFLWGLEMKEVAEIVGVSLATVERDWSAAKTWLAERAGS